LESASILQAIAEVAIGLAGFGGIAAGLGYRARGAWSGQDRTRLIQMVVSSLAVVFACFLPYAVHHLGGQQPWSLSSAVLVLAPAWFLSFQWRRVFAQTRPSSVTVQSGFSRSLAIFLFLVNLGALLLFLISAFRLARPNLSFGLYLAAVMLLLVASAAVFVRLLSTSFGPDEPAA
jgi:hypothetical protein